MNAAFQYIRLAAAPGTVPRMDTRDLVRLFGLDGLIPVRPQLVCRWHRDIDGRLSCVWTEAPAPVPRP
jgi:hypothetical protein